MYRAREALAYGVAFLVLGLVKTSNINVGRIIQNHQAFLKAALWHLKQDFSSFSGLPQVLQDTWCLFDVWVSAL